MTKEQLRIEQLIGLYNILLSGGRIIEVHEDNKPNTYDVLAQDVSRSWMRLVRLEPSRRRV